MNSIISGDLPEHVSIRVQDLLRGTPTLLIGSGFSCTYGLPHMGQLGDYLVSNLGPKLKSQDAKDVWAAALPSIRSNLENGLNEISNGAKGRSEIIELLRQLTADYIIELNVCAEQQILLKANPETLAPARLLRRLYDGASQNAHSISVITTNYDTLIELFCDIACLPVDTGFEGMRRRKLREGSFFQNYFVRSTITNRTRGSARSQYQHSPKKTVRLLKPHGSINWLSTGTGPIEVLNELACSSRAIVVPGPSKYEDAVTNTLFDKVRSEMNTTLGQTNSLLTIGFGFNDKHLQGIIETRFEAGMPALMLTRDLTPAANDVISRYPNLIAISKDNGGSVCYLDGGQWQSSKPLWQLDAFLSHFIE